MQNDIARNCSVISHGIYNSIQQVQHDFSRKNLEILIVKSKRIFDNFKSQCHFMEPGVCTNESILSTLVM